MLPIASLRITIAIPFQSLETLDSGKLFNNSVGNIEYAISTARYFAGAADKMNGDTIPAGMSCLSVSQTSNLIMYFTCVCLYPSSKH